VAEGHGEEVDWLDTLVESVCRIHNEIIADSGGAAGHHPDKLHGAVARPFHTVFGELLFKTPYEQSGALFHGIITSHAFVDGNKRTSSVLCAAMLRELASLPEPSSLQMRLLGELAVETASGGVSVEDVAFWLERIFALRETGRG
jgi:death-on-curing protein